MTLTLFHGSHSVILFQLYSYDYDYQVKGVVIDPRFEDRLHWNGSKNTKDLQDGSIYILNVTFSDAGTYRCIFNRILKYPKDYEFQTSTDKNVTVTVVPQRKDIFIRFMIALKGSFKFVEFEQRRLRQFGTTETFPAR